MRLDEFTEYLSSPDILWQKGLLGVAILLRSREHTVPAIDERTRWMKQYCRVTPHTNIFRDNQAITKAVQA